MALPGVHVTVRRRRCLVFPPPAWLRHRLLPRVSTACVAKTPLPCAPQVVSAMHNIHEHEQVSIAVMKVATLAPPPGHPKSTCRPECVA